uniref:EGF-like domain-containing protein n=1 Tax=Oryza punctata TaxID=4537 RepID=A0A0E0LWM9_ORYPU
MKKPVGSGSDHVSITIVLSCLAAAALLPSFAAAAGGEGSGNCTTRCGDINIEYPFGVEAGCYHPGFNLTCNRSSSYHSPRLFLGDGTVQVLDISVPNGTALINNSRIVFSSTNKQVVSTTWEVGSPYFLSGSNKIALVGCNARVDLRASRRRLISSCTAVCPSPSDAAAPSDSNSNSTDPIYFMGSGICVACSGVGCCQANISFADSSYSVEVQNLQEQGTKSIGPTDLVYIVQQDFTYHSDMAGDSSNAPQALPALLNWYISTDSSACRTPTNSTSASAPGCLSNNSFCQQGNDPAPAGYKCYCSPGYQGNPYIAGGCHDIDECKSPQLYSCYGDCNNTQGSHVCKCPHGYEGNPSTPNGCKGELN